MQKALCAVSTASIFLPWMQFNLIFTSTSANLLDLILGGGIESHILICLGGALFIAGSFLLLKWKKAPLLQVAGLIMAPVGFMVAMGIEIADYPAGLLSLQLFTGLGVYVGWAAAGAGILFMIMDWPTPRFLQNISRRHSGRPPAREPGAPDFIQPAPVVQAGPAYVSPFSFRTAMDTAEGHMAGGDLNAALTWYGRALGASRDDEERATSKVRIASVLYFLGKDQEARLFIQEARQIDPLDVSGWSEPLGEWQWTLPAGAAEAY